MPIIPGSFMPIRDSFRASPNTLVFGRKICSSFQAAPPNPAFKRTHTGGAGLWMLLASRAPVRAA